MMMTKKLDSLSVRRVLRMVGAALGVLILSGRSSLRQTLVVFRGLLPIPQVP